MTQYSPAHQQLAQQQVLQGRSHGCLRNLGPTLTSALLFESCDDKHDAKCHYKCIPSDRDLPRQPTLIHPQEAGRVMSQGRVLLRVTTMTSLAAPACWTTTCAPRRACWRSASRGNPTSRVAPLPQRTPATRMGRKGRTHTQTQVRQPV